MKKVFFSGLIAGIAMSIGNWILNPIIYFFSPMLKESYMNNPVFRAWDDPMMFAFMLYPFALGFVLAFIWEKTKHLFSGGCRLCHGFIFGVIFFFVSGLPAFLINLGSFTFPFSMVFSWAVMGLVNGIVAGCVLAFVNKTKKGKCCFSRD